MTRRLRRLAPALRTTGLAALLAVVAIWLTPGHAQSPDRIYRLGHLASTSSSAQGARREMLPALAKLGFSEGRNLVLDARFGAADELPDLMRELLAAKPDAIITVGPVALRVAAEATSLVPIISFGPDPVGLGFAKSLARPGGNVTGVMILGEDLDAKRLDLLHEAAPMARSVAVLFSAEYPPSVLENKRAGMRAVAASLGIALLDFNVAAPDDHPAAFAAMRAAGVQALVIGGSPQLDRDTKLLAARALEAQLPTACEWARNTQVGCLLGYSPSTAALRQRMADQVARILRGAAPGELPIERPSVFEFAVNLKIAKALGLTIPESLLARADEVIE